jgi:hypothetical protein
MSIGCGFNRLSIIDGVRWAMFFIFRIDSQCEEKNESMSINIAESF